MTVTLDAIRNCLEGAAPSVIATVAPDGTPNAALASHVHFVDSRHVALSFQFFSKTRENVLANPRALVQLVDPEDTTHYRLTVQYVRTETEGPIFESMKAKLAGIASHTGMSKVFRLQGSDIYEVIAIERVPSALSTCAARRRNPLASLRRFTERFGAHPELDTLLEAALLHLETLFDIHHAMVLMFDERGQRLYTVASRGYEHSGIGSEIALGEGVIGVAAQQRTPIRINYMAQEYLYSHAVRRSMASANAHYTLETEIPLPGLRASRSQLALPITLCSRLLGMLYAESPEENRFSYDDEDALVALVGQLAMALSIVELNTERHEHAAASDQAAPQTQGTPVVVRYFAINGSIFIGDDYLIKGVAGAIFWKLLRDFVQHQRSEFSNRELRLDTTLRLPDICDNLEARLILLQRRLAERCDFLRIEKTGRGRFRLAVARPLRLEAAQGAAG
jgi:adenylate cyclase